MAWVAVTTEASVKPRKPRKKKASGDCYQAAANYMMDQCLYGGNKHLVLVHGEVCGQGPLSGVTYGHAWVEDGDTVIDLSNGRNLRVLKVVYYAIGGVSHLNNTHRYTWDEAKVMLLTRKVYGPWELQTATGL